MGKVVQGKWKKNETRKELRTKDISNKEKVYQLKISLTGSRPEIWRRVLVPGNMNLGKLHKIIQETMGWTDTHLHQFIVKGVSYADPDPEMEMDDSENERQAYLYEIAPKPGSSFMYFYDFGDDWEHKIKVEKIMALDERFSGHPVCIDGRLSCPPEDCGGIYGYHDLLKIIKNPKHPEYDEKKEWLGEYFDSDQFDLEETNQLLKTIK